MSVFDEDLFIKGLEQRKSTLGADYVQKSLDAADDFTRPFQEAMTAWCWGFGWGDDVIDAKTRSMMNLSMIGALGKMHEWELHCQGGHQQWCHTGRNSCNHSRHRNLLRRSPRFGMFPGRTQSVGKLINELACAFVAGPCHPALKSRQNVSTQILSR
jgi:hypothetical protein